MLQRWPLARALLLGAPLLLGGCHEDRRAPHVSNDEVLEARFVAIQRTLDETRELKKRGRDIYPDCKGLEMLLTRDLKALRVPAVRKLIDEVESTCKGVKPAEP